MRDLDLIARWFEDLGARVRRQIDGRDAAALEWRADAQGNNVRETVWHMARWIDVLRRVVTGEPASSERWITDGWADRTGYDPRGIGADGLGTLTGYTFEEVLAIPRLDATELLAYLDSVVAPLAAALRAAGDGDRERTLRRATSILQGCFAHVGEIDALLAIHDRRERPRGPRASGPGAARRSSS